MRPLILLLAALGLSLRAAAPPHGAERESVSLDGSWTLSYGAQQPGAPETPAELDRAGWPAIPATVPGNVEIDLMQAGKLPKLEVGNNVYRTRAWEGVRWWYRRSFRTPSCPPGSRVDLVFEGLDCLGTVFVDGREVGRAANMFIAHRFDVTDYLRPRGEDNEVAVRIDSAVLAGRSHAATEFESAYSTNWESLSVRKAPHMYGWDIMPRLVSAGLWRGVRLEFMPSTRWAEVAVNTVATEPARRRARLLLDWRFQTDQANIDGWRVHVTLRRNGRLVHNASIPVVDAEGRSTLELSPVELWWPRGYGSQPLYDLRLELIGSDGHVLDTWQQRVGLRTVRLVRSDATTPDFPGNFRFVVNGVPIFIKGTNWVPLDALHSRDAKRLAETFALAVDLNCNMLRCWGGNVYEDHAFFDRCDENGILVWQDFAMACAIYPQDDAFAAALKEEADAVIRKLRNHPSLALWAGNNEVDNIYSHSFAGLDPNLDRPSRQVLRDAVRQLDPGRDYLPSSPYHSPALVAAGDAPALRPEDHLWGACVDFKTPFYTDSHAIFASEIGFKDCAPARASLEEMLDPKFLWPWQGNDEWLTHCVRPLPTEPRYNYRLPLMAKQIAALFGTVPDNLDDFILASQACQGEADKFFIELFRAAKWRRSGILWWNLRDGWPIFSDAVVDYYGRRKLAYGFIKQVQSDVCAIVDEPRDGRQEVTVVNDTLAKAGGRVTVRDLDTGRVLLDAAYEVPANGAATFGSLPPAPRPALWLIEWTVGPHAFRSHYLAGPRPVALADYKRWLPSL